MAAFSRFLPKRRWAQFSLGTLFLVVTVMCVWLGIVENRARRQREAVEAIEALGGKVEYAEPDEAEGFPGTFLRRWLPRNYVAVQGVYLGDHSWTDDGLSHLQRLQGLQYLTLHETRITDAGLAYLQALKGLQGLYLDGTQVTDAGLAHLERLMGLQELSLSGTQVTDAGLAHLHGLTGLRELWLDNTQVTDAGVARLRQALPNCRIVGP